MVLQKLRSASLRSPLRGLRSRAPARRLASCSAAASPGVRRTAGRGPAALFPLARGSPVAYSGRGAGLPPFPQLPGLRPYAKGMWRLARVASSLALASLAPALFAQLRGLRAACARRPAPAAPLCCAGLGRPPPPLAVFPPPLRSRGSAPPGCGRASVAPRAAPRGFLGCVSACVPPL